MMRPTFRPHVPTVLGVLLGLVAGSLLAPPATTAETTSVTIPLHALNNSGVTGTATLTAKGDQTVVVLVVVGASGDHPDHIHRSTCAHPEPQPTYPLNDVVLGRADAHGRSQTTVDVSLAELLAGEYLILVHKSPQEIGVYLACGDIAAETALPVTGAGATAATATRAPLGASTLGPLAAALVVGAVVLRRRRI